MTKPDEQTALLLTKQEMDDLAVIARHYCQAYAIMLHDTPAALRRLKLTKKIIKATKP